MIIKKSISIISKSIFVLFTSIVCAFILMCAVYLIPTNRIISNASKSKEIYWNDIIKTWSGYSKYGKLDTTTDAIMISNAVSRPYDSTIVNALLNARYSFSNKSDDDPNQESLYRFLSGDNPDTEVEYARYWHGYLLWMIPGLFFFDIGGLRTIMMFVQLILFALVLYEFSKKSVFLMIESCFIFCFLSPITTSLNFANSNCCCLLLLSLIFILKFNDWLLIKERYYYFFLVSGIITVFLDFFTYPIVVWGIPLITFISINNFSFKESFKIAIKSTLAWIFGYLGMWVGKWIVASLLTNVNVIGEAISRLLHWTVEDTNNISNVSFLDSLNRNLEAFDNPMLALLLLNIIAMIIWLYKKFKYSLVNKNIILTVLILLLLGLSTFVWYFAIRVPTFIHPWYHYRNFAILFWSISASVFCLTKDNQVNNEAD